MIEIYSCIRSNYQDQFQSLLTELSLYLYKNGDKMKISDFFNISSEVNGDENNKVYTISSTNGIIPQDKYFTKEIASRDLSKYKIIKKGQFAYNKSYSKHTPVGCVRKMYDNIGILSPFYMVLSPLSENNLFDYYFLTDIWNYELGRVIGKSARNQLSISDKEFCNIPVYYKSSEFVTKLIEALNIIKNLLLEYNELITNAEKVKKYYLNKIFN